jgi:hypothetical protein
MIKDELSMQRRAFHWYGRWVCDWMDAEHKVYLMTFMFEHMSGTQRPINTRMMQDVGNFWRTLSKWIVRRNRTAPHHLLPKLVAFPDRPVFKREKQTLAQVAINGGQHVHGILGIPATTRMREDLATHVASQSVYTDARWTRIRHIDVRLITSRPAYVADYALKSLKYSFADSDDLLILPMSSSEVPLRQRRKPHQNRE